jgi:toxin ParE1/3/4
MSGSRAYRIAPAAEADLEDIWAYTVKTWSAEQAESYHANFIDAFEGLASGAKTGRPADVREGYLKYAVGAHVVFYRVSSDAIEVIRVLHQRMDVNKHL